MIDSMNHLLMHFFYCFIRYILCIYIYITELTHFYTQGKLQSIDRALLLGGHPCFTIGWVSMF